jgi:hypothetical protein
LRVFISIQLLIKVAWGALFEVAFISLLIKGAKLKGQNYLSKSLHAIFKLVDMGFVSFDIE